MSTKNVIRLGIVAVALSVAAILLHLPSGTGKSFARGRTFLPAFDPDALGSIVIRKGKEAVTLQKKGDAFIIAEKNGYPASMGMINDLLRDSLALRLASEVTSNPANHAELGVDEGGDDAISVTFGDTKAKPILGFIKGKSPEGSSASYLRLSGEDTVYLMQASEQSWFSIGTTPAAFMDTSLTASMPKDQVRRVVFTQGEESFELAKAEDKKVVLSPLPEGKRGKQGELDGLFTVLSYLTFSDALPAATAEVTWEGSVLAELENGRSYTVEYGRKGETRHIRITSGMWDKVPEKKDVVSTLSKEEMEKMEALLVARDAAMAFHVRHAPWIYTIDSGKADRFAKKLADIIEDKPAEDEPEEVAASHILISWKGAERSDATRTKEEAKTLADSLLAKAKQPGADFAALAKEHSSCSSKTNGGDLGSFKKGLMAKAFEETAWKLKVGEISGVVETPFGYHIIKRTK